MSSENGKTVFEEAAAERELEELRLAIEESRARRRRANAAFDEFLKGFDERNRVAVPAPQPCGTAATAGGSARRSAECDAPDDEGLSAFEPASAPTPAAPVAPPRPATCQPLDHFAQDEPFTETRAAQVDPGGPGSRAILAGPTRCASDRHCSRGSARGVSLVARPLPGRRCPSRCRCRAARSGRPGVGTACGSDLRDRNTAASRGHDAHPRLDAGDRRRRASGRKGSPGRYEDSAERLADRDPRRRRRRGRVSIAGKDQGVFGPAGQPATRTFTVKR